MTGLLKKLGLDNRETQSWVLFDWGDNAFATVVLGVILPIYYVEVAGANLPGSMASVWWGYTLAISFAIVAVASPVLGAIADHVDQSRTFLAVFTGLGVVFTGALFFTSEGDFVLTSVLFVLANVGFSGARLFYNSLLPGITDEETIDRVSAAGYATGYLGGGTLLVVGLVLVTTPSTFGLTDTATASRVTLFIAACWWALFAIPLFVYVPEPEREGTDNSLGNPVTGGFSRLFDTYRDIQQYRIAFLFLIAFWFYTNGINAIITLSAAYATDIGLEQTDVMLAFVMVQFVGVPCAFLFGQLADWFSTKRAIYAGLAVYLCVALLAVGISTAWHFFALAFGVATVQGGTQGLSRSLFGSLIPDHKSGEFFSFFAIVSGFASILAPALFGAVGQITGSTRIAIGSLSIFFVVGLALLSFVDVDAGRTAARNSVPTDTTPENTTTT
jgi:UMF1 family MFS transporter